MTALSIVFACLAAVLIMWFVWVKKQELLWTSTAEDLCRQKLDELTTIEFDALVARIDQPHLEETQTIDEHEFVIGWRVKDPDISDPTNALGFRVSDDNSPLTTSTKRPSQIEEVEVLGFVDYMFLLPFSSKYRKGIMFHFLRDKSGNVHLSDVTEPLVMEPINRDLDFLSGLNASMGTVSSGDTPDRQTLAKAVAQATRETKGYYSFAIIEDEGQLSLMFEKPDRFHVTQTFGEDRDEWVTVGREHYRNLGAGWVTDINSEEDAELTHKLMVDYYVRLLETVEQVSIASYRDARYDVPARDFILVELEVNKDEAVGTLFEMSNSPALVTCWINSASNLIARVEVAGEFENEDGTSLQMKILQVFNYTCPSISLPEEDGVLEEPTKPPEKPTIH